MSAGKPDAVLAAIDLLAPALEASGLDEVEVESGQLLVRLARPRVAVPPTPPTGPANASAAAPQITPFGEPAPGMRFVAAPLTGVWYDAPAPGARPFVKVGDEIGPGSVIGMIEAMKLFNEIKAEAGGRVTRTLVESGTLVKRQQPLIEFDPR